MFLKHIIYVFRIYKILVIKEFDLGVRGGQTADIPAARFIEPWKLIKYFIDR